MTATEESWVTVDSIVGLDREYLDNLTAEGHPIPLADLNGSHMTAATALRSTGASGGSGRR